METVTQKQQSLIGLLPALELLFASANCQEEQKCEPSSLPNILSVLLSLVTHFQRLSNKGKIVAFTHVNSILQEYEETFDALSFAQQVIRIVESVDYWVHVNQDRQNVVIQMSISLEIVSLNCIPIRTSTIHLNLSPMVIPMSRSNNSNINKI